MSYAIVITEKGGKPRAESFENNEITIGRVAENDIVLAKGNISKRHSRIVLRDGKFIIVDLKSTNGTFVNGKRINAPVVLKDADKIYIGDYTLQLEAAKGAAASDDAKPAAAAARERPAAAEASLSDVDDPELFVPNGKGNKVDVEEDEPLPPAPVAPPAAALPRKDSRSVKVDAKSEPRLPDVKLPDVKPAEPRPEPRPEPRVEPRPMRADKPQARGSLSIDLPPGQALQARAAVFTSVEKNIPRGDNGLPPDDEATLERVRGAAEKVLGMQQKRLAGANTEGWAIQIAREVCALGPLTELLEDETVVELFINGPHQVLARRAPDSSSLGVPLQAVEAFFSSEEAVALVIRRIMHGAGLKFDSENPIAECRMADGTRVNAVHHAASVRGPVVTISRTSTRNAVLDELIAEGTLSKAMADFLELCVRARKNVCICGGAGSGTGTLLSALSGTIDDDERIVLVEQVARLRLPQPHVVALEPRPVRGGPSAATMRELVANALRMRPGRLVVHEVNGGEALELSVAMAGRQDGTLFTTYASTARDCLDRLETMIRMAGLDVQSKVVREQIAASVDVVVCLTRFADGSSRVTQIAEVTGIEVDLVKTQDIFTFKRERIDDNGIVVGRFMATGTAPRFYEDLQRRGDKVDLAIFRD